MMEIIIFFIVGLWAAAEVSLILVYGWYVKDNLTYGKILKNRKKQIRLNIFNPSIIYIGEMNYITDNPLRIISKYHISGEGLVLRWSKTHKKIESCFKKIIENE